MKFLPSVITILLACVLPGTEAIEDCQALRDFSLDAKKFFIDYRVSMILLGLTMVNIILNHIQKHVVTRFTAYKYQSAETNEEIAIRFMQLLFGSIVAFFGYSTLLFNGISGCNASELYLFYLGGNILIFMDLHEYVRRWPLRAPILGHHLMVFFFGLAMIEYYLLPADFYGEISWTTILIVSNIGFMWITDFFHVIFRISTNLRFIETTRKAYLVASMVRPITFCLMIYGSIEAGLEGSIVGAVPVFLMALAYLYNLYKAIGFVAKFDCKKYFESHQVKWVEEKFGKEISDDDIQKKRISMRRHSSTDLEVAKPSEKTVECNTDTVSSPQSRRSILETLFSIDIEEEEADVQEGLRGDVAIDEECEV